MTGVWLLAGWLVGVGVLVVVLERHRRSRARLVDAVEWDIAHRQVVADRDRENVVLMVEVANCMAAGEPVPDWVFLRASEIDGE